MMDYQALRIYSEPATEPVTTAEAKTNLRLDTSDHDTHVDGLIATAREMVEAVAGRALITQTWDLVLDDFPVGREIELPRPPLQSITSIKYTDEDGVESTFAASNYVVATYSEPGRIVLKNDASWPGDTLQEAEAVVVRYVAGYGDDASDVPRKYRHAILLLVAHLYEHPEAVSEVRNLKELPMGVQSLLWLDRVKEF